MKDAVGKKESMMPKNVGWIDKVVRFVVAAGLVAFGVVNASSGLWWVALVAVVPLATALTSFCPVWHWVGIKTISVKKL